MAAQAPTRSDALLAAALAGLSLLELADRRCGCTLRDLAVAAGFVLACTVPVAWRRGSPTAAFAVVAVAGVAYNLSDAVGTTTSVSGALVTLGTVLAVGTTRQRLAATATTLVGLVTVLVGVPGVESVSSVAYLVAVLVAAGVLGDVLRRRARVAAVEERLRLGRELHDGITGRVAGIVVRSAAAGRAFDGEPEAARAALTAIETSGRAVLEDLRALLATLPRDPRPAGAGGTDVAAAVTAAAADARLGGLEVGVEVPADLGPVPAPLVTVVRRLVQESLANVLRHAGGVPARVVLRRADGALEVEVVNGRAAPGGGDLPGGSARGLAGVQARILDLGGSFSAGPAGDGGFAVTARLPLERLP
jgi:signal transduction histidine kinase